MPHDPTPGCLTREGLARAISSGEIETVLTVFPDLYGRLVGKRIVGRFFLEEVADHGMHVCDYLLACDMEMDPVPGYALTSWQSGYGDLLCVPDFATLRRADWLERSAIVICDVRSEVGEPIAVAPRRVLQRQLERAAQAGYRLMTGSELEFFAFRDSFEGAARKGYQGIEPFGSYIEDYHILQGTKIEPLVGAIRRHMEASGVPVEFSKGEWGPGQQEINLRYAECLEMADRHVVYKHAVKEIAFAHDQAVTFMAKYDERHAGSSLHVHLSLWSPDGERPLFVGNEPLAETRVESSPAFRHFVAGMLDHARELTIFVAPTVNSYKRFMAATFAPTAIGWSYDNRTAGFRIVGSGSTLRIECRIPGADANPYLAFAALIAAGLDGLERRLEPPAPLRGNLYERKGLAQVPRSLPEAIACAEQSAWLPRALGQDVLEHYLHFARTEQRKFAEVVTSWERARFFERG